MCHLVNKVLSSEVLSYRQISKHVSTYTYRQTGGGGGEGEGERERDLDLSLQRDVAVVECRCSGMWL